MVPFTSSPGLPISPSVEQRSPSNLISPVEQQQQQLQQPLPAEAWLSDAPSPSLPTVGEAELDKERLSEALVDILLDAARREGVEV
jgi:hypothetical protein